MLVKLYSNNNNPNDLQKIVDILNEGGLIIYPTDTVYAIGCHALKEKSVEKICHIKGVDPRKSQLSIICYNLSSISEYAKIENTTFKLMKRNLPGPYTFILKSSSKLPKIFRNRKEIGIRVPNNPITCEIARLLNAPILSSSLPYEENEDLEYLTDPELIHEKFGNKVNLVVDGGLGDTEVSTVVDCTTNSFEIVRQGKGILEE